MYAFALWWKVVFWVFSGDNSDGIKDQVHLTHQQ